MPDSNEIPLPSNFEWGCATAAYQIEGGHDADALDLSIWDTFSYVPPTRTKGQYGDVACDHYNRWQEDIKLIDLHAAESYRFSISWSRIIPLGGRDDPIKERGIQFYSDLIDRCLAKCIQP